MSYLGEVGRGRAESRLEVLKTSEVFVFFTFLLLQKVYLIE